jgi:predicted phage terminase large subunit-like protein
MVVKLEDEDVFALEEEARSRARKSMVGFTLYTHEGYRLNWHHRLIARKLDAFIEGKIKRLIVTAPPRSGKSELVSRRMPAAIFGRNPRAKIISTSHGAKYASKLNRDVQRIMLSAPYKELYPQTRLSEQRIATTTEGNWLRNSTEFEIVGHGGYYMSAGVGGGIAGYGADYIIVDDPLRHRKDANSPVVRERIWEWFHDDLMNRLDGDGGVLVMATRFHEDDLIGRLINAKTIQEDSEELDDEDDDGETWHVLNLPARLDDLAFKDPEDPRKLGDILWPWLWAGRLDSLTTEQMIAKAKRRLGRREAASPYGFSALFQQRPTPKDGKDFKVEKLRIVQSAPAKRTQTVRYWDKAGTEGGGKYTAGVKFSKLEDGSYLIENVVRGQWSTLRREQVIKDTAVADSITCSIYIEREPGSGGKESAENTVRNLAGFIIYIDPPGTSKELRAEPVAAQIEGGNVAMLAGPWNEAFIEELRHFPFGTYKDQVDALSGAFNKLTPTGLQAALGLKR